MITLQRRHLLAALVPLVALLVVAGQRIRSDERGGRDRAASPTGLTAVDTVEAAPRLVVHVSGAVTRPGLYRLREGMRIADVVERAGGLKPRADLAALNLAAPLADGQHVIVPRRQVAGGAGGEALDPAATGAKVQLSTATAEQLDELPGVGPVTATKIVEWRNTHGGFRSVDDLDEIPGIGPARIEQLRDLVIP